MHRAGEIRDAVLDSGGWEIDCPYGDPECCGHVEVARPALHFKQWGSWAPITDPPHGVLPGDVCLSADGGRYDADADYVCAWNESDGTWLRYRGHGPKAGGKLLDGVDWCEFPEHYLAPA